MKNSSDTIGNRTRDLQTCSAVPQPTALRRAPHSIHARCLITDNCDMVVVISGIGALGGESLAVGLQVFVAVSVQIVVF